MLLAIMPNILRILLKQIGIKILLKRKDFGQKQYKWLLKQKNKQIARIVKLIKAKDINNKMNNLNEDFNRQKTN